MQRCYSVDDDGEYKDVVVAKNKKAAFEYFKKAGTLNRGDFELIAIEKVDVNDLPLGPVDFRIGLQRGIWDWGVGECDTCHTKDVDVRWTDNQTMCRNCFTTKYPNADFENRE